jgi:hypothetical protein
VTRFKEALLDELIVHARDGTAEPAAEPAAMPRRPPRRLVAVVAAAVAAAVAALLLGPFGASPAYAVVRHSDGSVSITFRELADPEAATRDLRAAGVPARVVRLSEPGRCPAPAGSGEPWQRPLPGQGGGEGRTMVFSPRPSGEFADALDYVKDVRTDGVTFVPGAVPPGAVVFLVEYPDNGSVVVGFGLVRAPGPACWEADPAIR